MGLFARAAGGTTRNRWRLVCYCYHDACDGWKEDCEGIEETLTRIVAKLTAWGFWGLVWCGEKWLLGMGGVDWGERWGIV